MRRAVGGSDGGINVWWQVGMGGGRGKHGGRQAECLKRAKHVKREALQLRESARECGKHKRLCKAKSMACARWQLRVKVVVIRLRLLRAFCPRPFVILLHLHHVIRCAVACRCPPGPVLRSAHATPPRRSLHCALIHPRRRPSPPSPCSTHSNWHSLSRPLLPPSPAS
jgi:hypothetical protein